MNCNIYVNNIFLKPFYPQETTSLAGRAAAAPPLQWAFGQQVRRLIDALSLKECLFDQETSSAVISLEICSHPLIADQWGFGWSWYHICKDFPTIESLYEAIRARHDQIFETKEHWRPYIEARKRFDPLYKTLEELSASLSPSGTYQISAHRLKLISEGISGSYYLSDEEGQPQFVIKPIDEDIDCLNNRKGYSSPYTDSTIRDHMPLYYSALRETAAYEFAKSLGIGSIVPRTTLAILESDQFYDQSDAVSLDELVRYQQELGTVPIREKLCSVQEFVQNSKTLWEGLEELQKASLSDEEIEHRFCQKDFEEANLLLWTTYDTDGHTGNFLVYPKSIDSVGNEILGIKKIDNGLAFPEQNEQLRNNLRYLPNAKHPLSDSLREKIASLSIDTLVRTLDQLGLSGSSQALRERLSYLKELVSTQPDLSINEIDTLMSEINHPKGSRNGS
jgi:hypothetical protein